MFIQPTVFQEGSDHMATIASAYFSKYEEPPSRFAEQDCRTCLNRASQEHEITVAHAEPYELGSEQAIWTQNMYGIFWTRDHGGRYRMALVLLLQFDPPHLSFDVWI